MNSNLFNLIKGINISSFIKNTSNTLNVIKKIIPVYKEVRPFFNHEKTIFKEEKTDTKSISYNDNLTFFN